MGSMQTLSEFKGFGSILFLVSQGITDSSGFGEYNLKHDMMMWQST